MTNYNSANIGKKCKSLEDKVFIAIERLLRSSGHSCGHLVSVVAEANKYCYKTFSGEIGVVDQKFIHDLI